MLLLVIVALVLALHRDGSLETNVLALLPATEQDAVVEASMSRFSDLLSKKHILLVGSSQVEQARLAARQLYLLLKKSGGFASIEFLIDAEKRNAVFATYRPFQPYLLSRQARQQLIDHGGAVVVQSTVKSLYNPIYPVNSAMLAQDPLLLFYDFLQSLPSAQGAVQLRDEMLMVSHKGRYYVLITLQLRDSPFSLAQQNRVVPLLDESIEDISRQFGDVDVFNVGVVNYARAGVESARNEVSTIGLGSLAGVVVLLLLVFRSALPLFISLLPIAMGFAAALAACLWMFGSVHMLTMVFGASLIGISIDYSFHFFCDRLSEGKTWRPQAGVARIFNGITLGLLTSIIGFVGLCLAPFPGMQQMALFSSVGLLAAYLTVLWLFPVIVLNPATNNGVAWTSRVEKLLHLWHRVYLWLPAWLPPLIISILIIVGGLKLEANDDIRLLQTTPEYLRYQEQQLKQITGFQLTNQYFLVEGSDPQEVLENEELLAEQLHQLTVEKVITGYDAISSYLPSIKRQQENYLLIKRHLIDTSVPLDHYIEQTGVDEQIIQSYKKLYQPAERSYLQFDEWIRSEPSTALQHLWLGTTKRGYASMVTLQGLTDVTKLEGLEQRWPHIHLINQVEDISNLFKRYRQQASILVVLSYGVIYLLLFFRYGYRRASVVMLPPVIAAFMTLAMIGLIGEALNVFHLLALLLVLGIGIDYTLFLEEGEKHHNATMLAIILSAATTILSFGLLALSGTPAVHSFGITVLIGIFMALLLSPMVIKNNESAVAEH